MRATCLCSIDTIYGITTDNNGNIYYSAGRAIVWKASKDEKSNSYSKSILFRYNDDSVMYGIVWIESFDILYAIDRGNKCLLSYSFDKGKVEKYGSFKFTNAWGITSDKNGNLYITDNEYVQKIHTGKGTIETITVIDFTEGFVSYLSGISVSEDGTIFVCDHSNTVRQIKNGMVSTIIGSSEQLTSPGFLSLGLNGTLYISYWYGIASWNGTIKSIKLRFEGVPNPSLVYEDRRGNRYVATFGRMLYKVDTVWEWERYLWIGHLKEDSSYCLLSGLPKDIIKEIASHLTMENLHRK